MKIKFKFQQLTILILCLIFYFYSALSFAENSKLVSYTYLGEFSVDKAKLALKAFPPLDTLEPQYASSLYKVIYKTTAPDGSETNASGLVAMPVNPTSSVALVSYHHGTKVTRSDVPSNFGLNYYIYPAVFSASGGYMVALPDYLGLGDNNLALHPYVQADTLATSCIDMIVAAKELAVALHYPLNDKLYLGGYSEGGFTTLVTYEALLKNHQELPVTATAVGSSPYDWKITLPFITIKPGPRSSIYAAYFFYSMQTYHHYWSGLEEIFKKPYDTLVPALYDGLHDAIQIQNALPNNPKDLLQDTFLSKLLDGSDTSTPALIANLNHYHFVSTAPLLLVGTKGDHDLPFLGSEVAYRTFKQTSNQVYIKSVSDVLDHIQAFPYVLNEELAFFKKYN